MRYNSRCRPCASALRSKRHRENRDAEAEASRAWKSRNRDRIKAYNAERQRDPEHRALKAFHQRLRKARIRSGQGDDPAIRAIYSEAKRVQKLVACCPVFDLPELGHEMHVDHVMPLARGGKHIASNLQILPKGINMRKGVRCPR